MIDGQNPRVSVLLAAYNEANTIKPAIESILNQTFGNFELLIIDDGSKDETSEQAALFSDERIHVIEHEQNRGLAASLNHGIESTQGEYIARMDADDRSLSNRFENQVQALDDNPSAQVAGCWCRIVGRDCEHLGDSTETHQRSYSKQALLEDGPGIVHGSAMIRRSALETVGGYDEDLTRCQDYDLWIRMADEFGPRFVHIVPEILYEYRVSADDIAVQRRQSAFSDYIVARHSNDSNGDVEALLDTARTTPSTEFTDRERDAAYHYVAATYLVDAGRVRAARRHLLKSARLSPRRIRPWYKLALTVVPRSLREPLQSTLGYWYRTLSSR